MAPGRLPTVLETDFESEEADGEKTDAEAGAAVDLPDGCREHSLGSTSHPWGTAHARLRHLGADDLPLDATSAEGLEPAKHWRAFLKNHREAIVAMDFFTVPTITFGVLYCFVVIGHDRRRILHVNVTKHPTSGWIIQQLREARWVGSCRRDLLDQIVALNERHLKRLLSEYVRYHHEDRTHLGLEKGTPDGVHPGSCPAESFMLYRCDDPIQDGSTKDRAVFGLGSSFGEPQGLRRASKLR